MSEKIRSTFPEPQEPRREGLVVGGELQPKSKFREGDSFRVGNGDTYVVTSFERKQTAHRLGEWLYQLSLQAEDIESTAAAHMNRTDVEIEQALESGQWQVYEVE